MSRNKKVTIFTAGHITSSILPAQMGERGVSLENMENMENPVFLFICLIAVCGG